VVAGLKSSDFLAMKVSLTSRGLGFHNSSSVGFWHSFRGKLRPNLMPAQPIFRISRELSVPSELRVPTYRFSNFALGVRRSIAIVEVVVAQFYSHSIEIERSDETRQPVPWNEEIDNMEYSDEDCLEQRGLEVG
jgi:hypothetical protein